MNNFEFKSTLDILLLSASSFLGKKEKEEFLNCSKKSSVKHKYFKRVIRQIKNENLFPHGRLSARARLIAAGLLLALVILLFCVSVVGISLLKTFSEKYFEDVEKTNSEQKTITEIIEITEFKKPNYTVGANETVLVKSSQIYNVEYSQHGSGWYYTQTPICSSHTEDYLIKSGKKVIDVCVGEHKGKVAVVKKGDVKIFSLYWDDGKYRYNITGTLRLAELLKIAESVTGNE